jgi:plasmid replication initiation protein
MELLDEKQAQEFGNKLYRQHNDLTSGRYDYSACQLDVLFMLIASLKEGQTKYIINTNDIELITGRKWNISQLTESTEKLLGRPYSVEMADGFTQFVLFQYFKYLKGTRSIEVQLSEISLPYFFDLKVKYTQFQLRSVLDCTSKFSKRIYMIACQWRKEGSFYSAMPILDFKEILGLYDKKTGIEQFSQIGQFKESVLELAKKQINEHTDIHFDYKLIKRGRSFTHIQIFVNSSKKNPTQLAIEFDKTPQFQAEVIKVMAYEFSKEQAELIVNYKEGYAGFEKLIFDLNEKIRQGKIKIEKSPLKYLIGVYQKKGVLPTKEK